MPIETLNQLLADAAGRHQMADALRYKEGGAWRQLSSSEWIEKARDLAVGLSRLGLERGDRIALLSENRVEWFICDAAFQILGTPSVPIYATLTPAQIAYIINNSESRMVISSTAELQAKVQSIRDQLGSEFFVTLDPPIAGFESSTLEELSQRGRSAREKDSSLADSLASAVQPEDLASIIYTSGTTGDPKGVMLTQRNLVENVKASADVLPVIKGDIALSALPYSHVFERMVAHYLYPTMGVSIAIAEHVDKVIENLAEIQPTVMTFVPRFYEKMHSRVMESVAAGSPLKQKIFHWSLETGRLHGEYRLRGEPAPTMLELKYKIASALAFKKLHQRLGGRLRFFVSGGAPLAKEIAEFFWAAGILILEGYGLTETSPVIAVNRPQKTRFGTVGAPVPGVEVKILEDGEILARGPNVMKGYYRNPEATREVIDEQGFFHTGDVGFIDSDGFLTITDRKKDIIVTAGGKNIAPQPIEGRLKTNPFIAEIVLVGNTRKYLSALVVPDFDRLTAWCQSESIATADRSQMAKEPRVVELIHKEVEGMTQELAQYEKIKKLTIIENEFTLENGELTPTMKVRRRVIEKKYKDLIDRMYD